MRPVVPQAPVCAAVIVAFVFGSSATRADTFVFGSDRDYPPFEYLDKQGEPTGFNIDLIRAIGSAAGFDVEIRLGPWHEIRHALENTGEVHISDMFYSRERAALVDFAQPFAVIHDEIFVHRRNADACRFDDLRGARVLVQRGSYVEDYLRSHDKGALLTLTDSEPEALRKLDGGGFDCAIVGEIVGQYTIRHDGLSDVVSNDRPLLPREYSFVTAKNNDALLARINQGLRSIKASGEYSTLYNRWFGAGQGISLHEAGRRYGFWLITPIVLVIAGIAASNIILRRRVEARARDLRAELAQRTRIERDLRESERRFRQLAESIEEVLWISNPDKSVILYVSPAYETIWGRSCDSLYTDPLSFLTGIHPDDRERVTQAFELQASGNYNEEYRVIRPDGSVRWVTDRAYPLINEQGEVFRIVGVAQDVTERKNAEERIEHLATRDPLTDLPNRHLLDDRLEQGLIHALRNREKLAVLFIDLDNFKNINDSLGHTIGDHLLREIGQRIAHCLRKEDTLARLGGDEFIALLKELEHAQEAGTVADKVLQAVAKPFDVDGHRLTTGCSIGIAIYPSDGTDTGSLMRNADTAMYHAKAKGRNNFQFFSQEMNDRAVERLTLEGDLRHALERDELSVHYQPKIELATGKIVGAEALLRWRHPRRGLLAPSAFIGIAEETGLIVPIGRWVLETAVRQAQVWTERGVSLRMAVNLSARQLHPNLVHEVATVLEQSNLPSHQLELEITETLLMEQIEENIALLRALHALGVHISIDDFGTGYSSLSYLKRFPIHALKIDRSFVHDIETDDGSLAIVKAINSLARSLRLRVVAEGVETANQLTVLRGMEVDEFQGFLICKPVPAEQFETRLALNPERPMAAE